jgi:hypothetical protein
MVGRRVLLSTHLTFDASYFRRILFRRILFRRILFRRILFRFARPTLLEAEKMDHRERTRRVIHHPDIPEELYPVHYFTILASLICLLLQVQTPSAWGQEFANQYDPLPVPSYRPIDPGNHDNRVLKESDSEIGVLMQEMGRLQTRLEYLESEMYEEVDLSEPQLEAPLAAPTHVLATRWFERFDIWGFAAFDYLKTGNDGTYSEGAFVVKETSLFVEAKVWEDVHVFYELQVIRLAKDDQKIGQTGELYAHFRNVCGNIGIKIGRVDIPFGEEYLQQDSIDNPLISFSAAYPYGFDEGIVIYGNNGGLGWIFAITDGTDARSVEDNREKAINAKLYGKPHDRLYLSGSFMRNGRAAKSAFEFGGSHFQPVGASHVSTLGSSPSPEVDALLYEVDARFLGRGKDYVSLSFGQAFQDDKQAFQDDNTSTFNRDLMWFSVEGVRYLCDDVYFVARYSEIGTYDTSEGYHFDGKITAGGNSAYGYDAKRLQRAAVGLGWKVNPRTIVKAELSKDWYETIAGSPFSPGSDDRWFCRTRTRT